MGDLSAFLSENPIIFEKIENLLNWHFERLSFYEQEVFIWLGINREPTSRSLLKDDIHDLDASEQVADTLYSLQRRLPLTKTKSGFTLQPVLMEFVVKKLVSKIHQELKQELETDKFQKSINGMRTLFFNNFALIKVNSKDYIQDFQRNEILKPVLERLKRICSINEKLSTILNFIRSFSYSISGYAAGNILNLLCEFNAKVTDYNFSSLEIRHACLQGKILSHVNFENCHFISPEFTTTMSRPLSVTLSSDGKLIATGDANGDIRLWETENGKQHLLLQGHSAWVSSVAFSPSNNNLLVSGSEDRLICFWDLSSGELKTSLKGHLSRVRSVAFSPDGFLLVSSSDDCTIKIWNIEHKECLCTLEGHKGKVNSIAFSPDGSGSMSPLHEAS